MSRPFHLAIVALTAGCSNDVSLNKGANVAPTAAITAPDDRATFEEFDTIEFVGTVADGNGLTDIQAITWLSDADGLLGEVPADAQGIVRLPTTLSPGAHTVTLAATDSEGATAQDSITVIVEGQAQAPFVEISNPGSGATFAFGDDVTLVGGVSDSQDPADDLLILWSFEPSSGGAAEELFAGNPTSTGSTSFTWVTPPVGNWRVVLEATDSDGNSAADEIVLEVFDPNDEDNDNDGVPAGADCDDDDPDAFPGNDETCDGIDNDCDGVVDDKDFDVDGHIDEDCVSYTGPLPVDDCDDTRSSVHPGAPELDDGIDNDCDLDVDEGTDAFDDDGDCFCEGATCGGTVDPSGCPVLGVGDCDDSDAAANPVDGDGDGFSTCDGDCDDGVAALHPVDGDGDGFSTCDGDCDDTDPELNPEDLDLDGASTCDGDCDDTSSALNLRDIDSDGDTTCDGDCNDLNNALYAADRDGDGYSTCDGDCDDGDPAALPFDGDGDGATSCAGDCDDTDPTRNARDDDNDGFSTCDGDCDDTTGLLSLSDIDGDGFSTCLGDCNDFDPAKNPADRDADGYSTCDGDCNDADPALDLADADADGQTSCAGDCDDAAPTTFLGALEIVGDGIDQDCDGGDTCWTDDDLDGQGIGTPRDSVDLDCVDPGESLNRDDCDDRDDGVYLGAPEVPADGVDQDCDGVDTCFVDADDDGVGTPTTRDGVGLDCDGANESTTSNDCDDTDPGRFPGNAEVVADGVDQDCDAVDTCWRDGDLDGFGSGITLDGLDLTCAGLGESTRTGDCNDGNSSIYPGATETLANGVDEDCNGTETCYQDLDNDGFGSAALAESAVLDCVAGLNVASVAGDCADTDGGRFPGNPEIVGDGRDQDCDLVDSCYTDADDDDWGVLPIIDAAGPVCGAFEATRSGDCDDGDASLNEDDLDIDGWSTCAGDCDDLDPDANLDDLDRDGSSTCAGDCDDADDAIYPGAPDVPDALFVDADCDGIDGVVSAGAFVAPSGSDANFVCTRFTPCKTLNKGILDAAARGLAFVYVQGGVYAEAVTLAGGVDVIGGYDTSWVRDRYTNLGHVTDITGGAFGLTPQYLSVYASNLASPVVLDNVVVSAPDAVGNFTSATAGTRAGRSSYGIYVFNSDVEVRDSEVRGGRGADGGAGSVGVSATQTPADAGDPGLASDEFFTTCSTSRRSGGSGGSNTCSGVAITGGGGGSSGSMDTNCGLFSLDYSARGGLGGGSGSGGTSPGGGGGGGGVQVNGSNGTAGGVSNGSGGAGALYDGKIGLDGFWYARNLGGSGILGADGGAGGGGGGGGGSDNGTDETGGSGGGGGSGGCKSTVGGLGGGGGGSSFAIFAHSADIQVTGSVIVLGTGGAGGAGGMGGAGQPGGAGGLGGAKSTDGGNGGNGGAGGHGGHSGGGGGGPGGAVYGIFTYASTVFESGNAFSGGTAGSGGAGGARPSGWADGNAGTAGGGGVKSNIGTCASSADC